MAYTVSAVVVIRVNNGKKDHAIWSLMRRGWLSNVASSTPEHLVQRIRPAYGTSSTAATSRTAASPRPA
ncbi:hypothetical protein [Streptomyces griseoaurantiacus]